MPAILSRLSSGCGCRLVGIFFGSIPYGLFPFELHD